MTVRIIGVRGLSKQRNDNKQPDTFLGGRDVQVYWPLPQ